MFDRSSVPQVAARVAAPKRPAAQAAPHSVPAPHHLAQLQRHPPAGMTRSSQIGLPERLKAGVEALSGVPMDDVHVRYSSSEPARLGAHAFARGRDIHLGPGQEHLLPHEAWHLVQQAQGRVRETRRSLTGAPVNDDGKLEAEADVMGGAALRASRQGASADRLDKAPMLARQPLRSAGAMPAQLVRCKVTGCRKPDEHSTKEHGLKRHALKSENSVRQIIPYAANQISDLEADKSGKTLARHEQSRHMNQRILKPSVHQPFHAAETETTPQNTLATAAASTKYQGGMCNEYSAVTMANLMAHPPKFDVDGLNIVRHWNGPLGHSFTTIGGDERSRRGARPTVVDPWTTKRDPVLMSNSVVADGWSSPPGSSGHLMDMVPKNTVIAHWQDRMQGEGKAVVDDAFKTATDKFDEARKYPAVQYDLDNIEREQNNNQTQLLYDIRHNNSRKHKWLYEHPTNRK